MNDLGAEIDQIFIQEKDTDEADEIELIMKYIKDSKEFMDEIGITQEQIMRYVNIHDFYKLKLETLSRELCDIEENNIKLDMSMHNQQLIYDTIQELLKATEIKDEHFENLTSPDFEDLASIQISLHRFRTHTCDYDLKAVRDIKMKIKTTLKEFVKKFILYFQKELNKLETESTGELKIHGHVYKIVKPFEFIIEFSKEAEPENFVLISQKYIKMAKGLYESEFEAHLEIVHHSLKDSKTRHKEKMEEIFGFVFESFLLILTSEDDFLKNYFFDDARFLNEATLTIFSDVVEIILDFLKDSYRVNNILTISAMYKNRDIEVEYKIKHLDVYIRFKNKTKEILTEYEKNYVNSMVVSWGYESKQKLIGRIAQEIKNSSNTELNIDIINLLIDKIMEHKKDSKRGKVEFEIYRYKLLYMLQCIELRENKDKMSNAINIVNEKFEREIITYIFSTEQKKMPSRISNVLKVIKDYFQSDQNNLAKIKNLVKTIVYDHVTQEFKKEVEGLFS